MREFNASDFPPNRFGLSSKSLMTEPLSGPRVLTASIEWRGHMRNLVQPPPSMHCEHCRGELLFKRIEPDDPAFDIEVQMFVCAKCGR
jgi:hypothetical protein